MKKLSVILFLSLNVGIIAFGQKEFKMPTAADFPKLKQSGQKCTDVVPPNWEIIGKAFGDLNADKLADCVLAIKGKDAQFISNNDNLGTQIFNTNPRILVILFRNRSNDGYKIVEQSNTFIISADYPTIEEPFDGVSIKNGILQFDFNIFMNAGGWGATNSYYKFKYLNGEFALIGADRNDRQRNSGETEDRSYNFLTKKVEISLGNYTNDNKPKSRRKTIKLNKLKTLKTFAAPYSWEIEQDYFL